MTTTTNAKQVKMNIMTQAQYDTITPSPTELYVLTDADAITVDSALSSSSTNPVQNKVINTALNGKQDSSTAVTHTASTAVGNLTTPVYINSSGVATALSFTIAKSVPSDAVFTDTTYSDFVGSGSSAASGLVPKPSTTAGTSKYLCENGTWATPSGTTYTFSTGLTNTSGTVTVTDYDKLIKNTATGTNSVTILGTPSSEIRAVNIGVNSTALYSSATALGYNAQAENFLSLALGAHAVSEVPSAIQIGAGTNSTASTLAVGFGENNFKLLDGTTGLIPDDRLSSNIQRTNTAVTHTASTAVGDVNTPVYINSSGVATALSFTIATSVPSGAVFTDTKNTAGSTDTSSKIFLIGATSQAANPQTYSQDTAFVDANGRLNSAAPASGANDTTVATTKWVKDQGYTTNTGTVTSVNNVSPVSGNVTLSIPSVDQTYDGTSLNAQSGTAVAGALQGLSNTIMLAIPDSISDLTDDTATYPIDKADTLTGLTASITELNYVDGVTSAIQTQLDGKLSTKPDGTNNLIDSNNKVNVTYMPDVVLGQMLYAGTFVPSTAVATLSTNAKTILGTTSNTITLTNDTTAITGYAANEGNYYIASGDGTFASISFLTGDWLISTGSGWTKVSNTDAVTGVKGNAESTYRTGNVNITADNVLPSQSSQSGKFLTTNGSTASWGSITGLPSQTSQSGKYLTTNGTSASWASLSIPTTTSSVTSGSSAALTSGGAYTNLVTSVAAHSTDANKINVTKAGSASTITINDVAHATSADSATSATTASKLGSSDVGSATQPIYLDDGEAKACTYTLAKSVPSDAVFTDTTYSTFTGATSIAGGTSGLVPTPSTGDNDKILMGNSSWSSLKTINSTSILGSGNITVTPTVTYDQTTQTLTIS